MKLKCRKCRTIWNYSGHSKVYATCTSCKTSIKIKESEVQDGKDVDGKSG